MADSSNLFTMDGLNRNRKMSGLYAHRPDNASIYFDYKQIKISPQFVSILNAEVIGVGYNYSKNTTITFPQPEHPSGVAASGRPLFNVAKSSFTITNPGTGYSLYDNFPIVFDNSTVGSFFINQTGINGSITDYEVIAFDNMIMTSQSSLPIIDLTNNPSATIVANDKFTISNVDLTYIGIGYQTITRASGLPINHDPIISNAGNNSPSGLVIKSSIDPYVAKDISVDNRKRPAKINRFEEIQVDQYLTQYMVITNYSLGDYNS